MKNVNKMMILALVGIGLLPSVSLVQAAASSLQAQLDATAQQITRIKKEAKAQLQQIETYKQLMSFKVKLENFNAKLLTMQGMSEEEAARKIQAAYKSGKIKQKWESTANLLKAQAAQEKEAQRLLEEQRLEAERVAKEKEKEAQNIVNRVTAYMKSIHEIAAANRVAEAVRDAGKKGKREEPKNRKKKKGRQ